LNLTAIKRQAKRLQKASAEIFGQEFPLSTCQQAVARSHGFQHWHEAERVLSRIGADRTNIWWTLDHRSDRHQEYLEAIVTLEIELSLDKPVAFFGQAEHAAVPALRLFMEEMSYRQMPGLILVETDQLAVQDTALWPAVTMLGHEAWFKNFRCLDLRERTLPVAITASPEEWFEAAISLLSYDEHQNWVSGDEAFVVKELFRGHARQSDTFRTDFYPARQVCYAMLHPDTIKYSHLARQKEGERECDLVVVAERSMAKRGPSKTVQKLAALIEPAFERNFGTGVSLVPESKRRPVVALFSREDSPSFLLANRLAVLFQSGTKRPVLYCADKPCDAPPTSLTAFPISTIFVPGEGGEKWAEWSRAGLSKTLTVHVGERDIVAAGRRYAV
jgi:hypothetical protein